VIASTLYRLLLLGSVVALAVVSANATDAFDVALRGINDRGNTDGRHYFELYGDFPGSVFSARIFCNGVEVPWRREFVSAKQINVSIFEMAGGTKCSFLLSESGYQIAASVDRGMTSGRHYFELYGTFPTTVPPQQYSMADGVALCSSKQIPAKVEWQGPLQINVSVEGYAGPVKCDFSLIGNRHTSSIFGPITLQAPPVEILGLNDRGTTHSVRYFELYGRFQGSNLEVESICNGLILRTAITYSSPTQVNIALNNFPVGDWVCGLSISGNAMGRKQKSPIFHRSASSQYPAVPNFLGAYYWGGLLSYSGENQILKGVTALRSSGFRTVRLVLSPRVRGDFQNAVESLPYSIDTTGWGQGFMDPSFINSHADDIRAEYRDLTVALYETQHDTGKRFIIANWETDNTIYCGAFSYVTNPASRSNCLNIPSRIAGLEKWFEIRKAGIREGRIASENHGLHGVVVEDGIEFNSYQLLDKVAPGTPSTLYNIIPNVKPAWASYSSYETINKMMVGDENAVKSDLAAIEAFLASTAPNTKLMIGEVGYPGSEVLSVTDLQGSQYDVQNDGELLDKNQNDWTVNVLRLLRDANVPIVILWVGASSTLREPNLAIGMSEWQYDGVLQIDGQERFLMKAVWTGLR
jgi:hypothetical protein